MIAALKLVFLSCLSPSEVKTNYSSIKKKITPGLCRVINLCLHCLSRKRGGLVISTRHNQVLGIMTQVCHLPGEIFIQRFLLHELPSGFMRIRHFGFLGNNCKKERLEDIRTAIGVTSVAEPPEKRSTAQLMLELTGIDITLCSQCRIGTLKKIDEFDGVYKKHSFFHWGKLRRAV